MRFTFLVAGIVTFSMLPTQTEAIQFDEAYDFDQFAQLDAIPPQKPAAKKEACKDLPWLNNHGHTCADIAKDKWAKPDWTDKKGVRADAACCKFGGGSTKAQPKKKAAVAVKKAANANKAALAKKQNGKAKTQQKAAASKQKAVKKGEKKNQKAVAAQAKK